MQEKIKRYHCLKFFGNSTFPAELRRIPSPDHECLFVVLVSVRAWALSIENLLL
jgi:hypothetical protein